MLESLLISFGGQIVGKLVARRFGAEFGELAETALSQLGEAFGVGPDASEEALADAISKAPEADARRRVMAVEVETADLVLAKVALQEAENANLRETSAQIEAEKKGHWFGWAWRPAWMWGLLLLWVWSIPGVHLTNAIMKWAIPPTDLVQLTALTALISGLYMGGHTIKDFVAKKWGSA